jgi:outer membrane protein OmpA-like peptidoglycan-associated protein
MLRANEVRSSISFQRTKKYDMRLFLIAIGLLACSWLSAQPTYTTAKTTSEKARKSFEAGRKAMQENDPADAIRSYKKALELDPKFAEARFYLGGAHFAGGNWAEAEAAWEQAMAEAPDFATNKALLPLAEAEWKQRKFIECAEHAEAYAKDITNYKKNRYEARRMAENARFTEEALKNPVPFNPQPLPAAINTVESEYLPALTADGTTLIFTRLIGGYNEDFYQSERTRSDTSDWQTAVELTGINSTQNEGAQAISADGTWLVLTACNRREDGSQGGCDLYLSQYKNDEWTQPTPFSAPVNSTSWDAQPSISADGKSLYFSSDRPGSRGGRDLWVVYRSASGKWGTPQKLDSLINTLGDEQTPFIHPDGQTLYFTSNGHPGMGNNDIYFSRKQPDGTWGKPENLGFPINTEAHEGTLCVSLDGKTAYFAAERPEGKGKLDLYYFDMPLAARPRPVTYARIKVTDGVTGRPLIAKIEISDLSDGHNYLTANTKKSGTALVCLPAGTDYAVTVAKDKYLFHSENFNLTNSGTYDKPFELKLQIWPVRPDSTSANPSIPAIGHPVVLRNVFFETGSSQLRPESNLELGVLARFMTDNPTVRFQINGHTDDVGDDNSNQRLSEARADAVRTWLVGQGISAERLRTKGYGESKPVMPNDTDEHRAANRRTEFEAW